MRNVCKFRFLFFARRFFVFALISTSLTRRCTSSLVVTENGTRAETDTDHLLKKDLFSPWNWSRVTLPILPDFSARRFDRIDMRFERLRRGYITGWMIWAATPRCSWSRLRPRTSSTASDSSYRTNWCWSRPDPTTSDAGGGDDRLGSRGSHRRTGGGGGRWPRRRSSPRPSTVM